MQSDPFTTPEMYLLLFAYVFVAATISTCVVLRCRTMANTCLALGAWGCLAAVALAAGYVSSQQLVVDLVIESFRERRASRILAMACGLAAAAPWVLLVWPALTARAAARSLRWAAVGIVVPSLWATSAAVGLFICDKQYDIQRTPGRVLCDQFVWEPMARLENEPVRLAAGEPGSVYVSYYTVDVSGRHNGGIDKIWWDEATSSFQRRVVAASPALYRPYGLAWRDGDLFVSRSGHVTRVRQGHWHDVPAGAVTRLKDLDGDGYYEYYDDVIDELPGARSPDTMHQNNGIAFDASGNLYIAQGTNDDRSPDPHPWGGTILKASADFQSVQVFARGLRNPFGITMGPDQNPIVTDNDVASNPGDEINYVQPGGHYGHPYVTAGQPHGSAEGFVDPIYVGGPGSNLLGIAYAHAPQLPEGYRNCLYVTDYLANVVYRMRIEPAGSTYRVTDVAPFAVVQSPVDVVVNDAGEIFVASRNYRRIYRVRPQDRNPQEGT